VIAGGRGEHDARAFVMGKRIARFRAARRDLRHDDRLALRQSADEGKYGVDSMPETAENVAVDFQDPRARTRMVCVAQPAAVGSAPQGRVLPSGEIVPVTLAQKKGDPKGLRTDEHPRPETTIEQYSLKLKGVVKPMAM